ncbi:methyltransferase [Shewanella dokdonensis]|uniref:Ribosomal RNA large subunit methyltransferase G n=2 Tax=Shewanella dokdonensis TaxID=712036 RepID=A0ABX8DFL3_9GAMM|nr:methyltransferase [Shewanella dokdonensis]MCL1073689.1 methyltransferase [Shewanella dokdonensis]QVK22582.1 methyltransferase [Shewanella dokdonensis]
MTQFAFGNHVLELHRYPSAQQTNLQAWDAADEYLLQVLEEKTILGNVQVINDSFGALLCALKAIHPQLCCFWVSDAATSHFGAQQNLNLNQLTTTDIHWCQQPSADASSVQLTLMKLPKNLNYFAWQLTQLSGLLPAGSELLIGAKAKSINASLLQLIAQHFGPASASLAWKKTRVISATADGHIRPEPQVEQWAVPEYRLQLSNLSNVFAASKLDIGARLMLQHLPQGEFHDVIDLGCGNGILGLRAAQLYPSADIHFVDDSAQAITSAKQNWQQNTGNDTQGHFYWDDCLSHLPADIEADLILCNPPFHQGEAITDHIAWQMFVDARRRLQAAGKLQVVGNRHLGYHTKLKRLFGNCHTVASNQKFVVLQAIK